MYPPMMEGLESDSKFTPPSSVFPSFSNRQMNQYSNLTKNINPQVRSMKPINMNQP